MLGARSRGVKPRARFRSNPVELHSTALLARTADEESDGRDSCPAGARHMLHSIDRDTADRQHGDSSGFHNFRETVEPQQAMVFRFRRARPHGSGDQIVNRRDGRRFLCAVHRASEQESIRRHATNQVRCDRIAAQVDAVRTARQRDIDAIADDDPCTRSAGSLDEVECELDEIAGFQIAFAHDDAVDSGVDGMFSLLQQTAPGVLERPASCQTLAIGDEMQDHSRAVNTKASSEKPASRLSTPRPLTAPRTKWFLMSGRRMGQIRAK
jgi:hypothetical protein